MKQALRISLFSILIFAPTFTNLSFANADESYVADYYNCARFLKMSPKQQRAIFIPGRLGFNQLVSACQTAVHRGVKSAASRDRQAAAGKYNRSARSNSSYRDECHQAPESLNCANHGPGSIYDQSGCNQNPSSMECN